MSAIVYALMLAFVAAQGFAIFTTAYLAVRALGLRYWVVKPVAMGLSYLAWVAFTLVGYFLIGGEGGFMDGFGMMLTLCFTALLSSAVFMFFWLAAPLFGKAANG